MTCGDFIEYLESFDLDDDLNLVAADMHKRIKYKISDWYSTEDEPAILINIDSEDSKSLDS